MVIRVGHPLCLVVGVWSCVHYFRGACHCQWRGSPILYGWWFLASEQGYRQGTYFGCGWRSSSLVLITASDVAAASCMVGGIQQGRARGDMHGVLTSAVGGGDWRWEVIIVGGDGNRQWGGVVVGEKEVAHHNCYRLPDLGWRGLPDQKIGIFSISLHQNQCCRGAVGFTAAVSLSALGFNSCMLHFYFSYNILTTL